MRRSCISTVSCLGLARGMVAPPYLTAQPSSMLPLRNSPSSSPFPEAQLSLSLSLSIPSQNPDTPHFCGPPELWGPAAGCSSVCQGAGCEKCDSGEEPWSRQAGHPEALPLREPRLCPGPAHSRSPTSTLPHLL